MRSHRNENGHTLLVVPRDMIGPFRNALQKLAGGIDFFALDPAERESLDQALRHLWNPGDDAQGRDKTVPIDVLALNMRDGRKQSPRSSLEPADALESPTIRKPTGLPSVLTRLSTRDRLAMEQGLPAGGAPVVGAPGLGPGGSVEEDGHAAMELELGELTGGADRGALERPARHDGYRAPSKGRHPDVSR